MTMQTTVLQPVSCSGIGLHSGEKVTLAVKPGRVDSGIVFRRAGAPRGKNLVPARYDLVSDTRLGTTLSNRHGVSVSTVEHLMAALWGAGIDNAIIDIDGPEAPIMDGSSAPFMELLARAGTQRLSAPRRVIRVLKEVEVLSEERSASVAPLESEDFGMTLDVTIDFGHSAVARSRASYDFRDVTFGKALSRARTFGFADEVERLRAMGLARGGSLENAVVVGEGGVLNVEGLRMPDEFVRHKALDCVGDLYLAGYRIEGAFTFLRPGHCINNALLRALMADESAWQLVSTAAPQISAAPQAAAYL